ncbi:MAG: hypothetical protein JST54_14420 [Deltaproteobacteria bacterium]|nr:hypothetical protein [Deltaproteobacteria bacterium]
MVSEQSVAVSALYLNGEALPPPELVQRGGGANELRLLTSRPPPIDEHSVVELAVVDGRRIRLKVMAIDTVVGAGVPRFSVLARVVA